MTILVPFDGSELARAALEKAVEYGDLADEDVLALTVVPDDEEYARERGWIGAGEPFEPALIAGKMGDAVDRIAPAATFRYEVVNSDEPTSSPTTNVVRTIRRVASEVDAAIVFVGSENAGTVTTPLSSVGGPVAGDQHYDVYVARHAE